jgi:hypothetical protein
MHEKLFQNQIAIGWKISRMNFFRVGLAAASAYQFPPWYLFTALTTFSWITL